MIVGSVIPVPICKDSVMEGVQAVPQIIKVGVKVGNK